MKAPMFTLKDLNSHHHMSLNDFKGKAILLTFWVSWCPDSQRDLGYKQLLYNEIKTDDFVLLMINVTGREHKKGAGEKYYQDNHFTFPALKDEGTKVYDQFQCMSVPTTFLLNKQHIITATFHDKATLAQMIEKIGHVI
ncbi:TlpA disulfide reductase family protein [Salipaludibacillus agaradhaerens]|uniref:TlpA disulfide reductase family protein n=1 Tax=Salipaludibacillus agaradhaerens TaxID=76935 RepID=UPI000998864D|nr:TlpA disulfide reductase family protein [Salipaludibacillus agaradhaerens]